MGSPPTLSDVDLVADVVTRQRKPCNVISNKATVCAFSAHADAHDTFPNCINMYRILYVPVNNFQP